MAMIALKMGVEGSSDDFIQAMDLFEFIDHADVSEEAPFVLGVDEEGFADSLIGLLIGMSADLDYTGSDGARKTFTGHFIQAFERFIEKDGKAVCKMGVSPTGRKLIRAVCRQSHCESDEERSRLMQQVAEDMGLL